MRQESFDGPHSRVESRQGQVFLLENHDEALTVWRQKNVAERILVHIDAHHDMWWKQSGANISFANYICPALQEKLVREIYWVVPHQSWSSIRNRQQIISQLRRILRIYPRSNFRYRFNQNSLQAEVLGRPLHICSLESLPFFIEPVLLDIDVDFLMFPRVAESDPHPDLPCLWPEELLAKIQARNMHWDIATVAYSVEGGYTPLRWKYLGKELALRLERVSIDATTLNAMESLKAGAEAANHEELDSAELNYREALALWPGAAAPRLHLALLFQRRGELSRARDFYQEALELDNSYRTLYSGEGLWHYWDHRYTEANREFRSTLEINPNDATSLIGLAWLAMRRRRWTEAETLICKALEFDRGRLDAHRTLGMILERQGRFSEAITALERSLQLARTGQQSQAEPTVIYTGDARLVDNDHWRIFVRIGRLYHKQGDMAEARKRYQVAIAAGHDSLMLRWQLLRLAAIAQGKGNAVSNGWQFAKQLLKYGVKLTRRTAHGAVCLYEMWLAR